MKLNDLSKSQARDTGMAMVLLLLLLIQVFHYYFLGMPAIIVLIVTMTWPLAFAPLARLWFGLSHLLGVVVSRILLTLVFFLLVTPVGLLRRVFKKEEEGNFPGWRTGLETTLKLRDYKFTREDLEKPY